MSTGEGSNGRDVNPHDICKWRAGGGVKGGPVIRAADAVDLRAAVDKTHAHDRHAIGINPSYSKLFCAGATDWSPSFR
jgi:hypothetical protein